MPAWLFFLNIVITCWILKSLELLYSGISGGLEAFLMVCFLRRFLFLVAKILEDEKSMDNRVRNSLDVQKMIGTFLD